MKPSQLTAASLALSASATAQYVQLGIQKRHNLPNLRRRGDTLTATLQNDLSYGGYFTNVKIGTPAQALTLQLDTGSSDIWVPYDGASVCTKSSQSSSDSQGCTMGSFNPDKSSTFVDLGQDTFHIEYVDGSYATGDYFEDVFVLGGTSLQNMTMGLGVQTNIPFGLIGIGYEADESSITTVGKEYPNFPVALMNAGDINSVAYSLWLDDLQSSTGSILFGAINTDKYVGDLIKVNVQTMTGSSSITSFLVDVTEIQAVSSSGSDVIYSGSTIQAVLDSGTTLTYLPQDVAESIWSEVGAEYSADFDMAIIPCSMASHSGHISYTFGGPGGPRINVTLDELVLSGGDGPQITSGKYKGDTACEFGIQNTTGNTFLLGDTFLRSAYVVYDLANNQIALANTDFNSTSSNIVAFASKSAPIPSATSAPSQSASISSTVSSQTSASEGFQSGGDDSAAMALTALSWPGLLLSATLILRLAWS